MTSPEYQPHESYIRVGAGCPEVSVGNVSENIEAIKDIYDDACRADASLVVFPELSITGYSIGDVVNQNDLLSGALRGLTLLANHTSDKQTAMVVGLPLQINNALYNCAAVVSGGKIRGIVPKINLPTYGEFYEDRWYQSWDMPNTTALVDEQEVPFGTQLIFDIGGVKTGVEICEDLWVSDPPSRKLSENGALIIANPSASPEQLGKQSYRHQLVSSQAGRLIVGYVYAGCGSSESTMDVVMSGHQLIAENGTVLSERPPFNDQSLILTDIDVEHLRHDRRKQGMGNANDSYEIIDTEIIKSQTDLLRKIDQNPFLPNESEAARAARLKRAFDIQVVGLSERMKSTKIDRLVLGLSGGLDSALALLVAHKAAKRIGHDPKDMIHAIIMPGPASGEQTQSDAVQLAEALGVTYSVKPIGKLVDAELELIGHDGQTEDVTYENVQARARTTLLFNYANLNQAMVLGTGDLSEIAAGWCTYNGDHMSHYNVNASLPKTMVRAIVRYLGETEFHEANTLLQAITERTVSPELVSEKSGELQSTDDLIGPIALRDFFLGYVTRYGDSPRKIHRLATEAFKDEYDSETINRWLEVYLDRFYGNQWKRSVMPDGPKIGSVALSPRGDWRAPSDMPKVLRQG